MWKFPPLPRDRAQAWLSLALSAGVCVGLGSAAAQDEKKAAPPADAAKKAGKAAEAKEGAEEPKAPVAPLPPEKGPDFYEVILDPNAEKALANEFPELPAVALTNNDAAAIAQQAAGKAGVDPALVDRWIKHYAAELTRKQNIAALVDPKPENRRYARALDDAASRLLEPLRWAHSTNPPNAAFLAPYRNKVKEVLPPLLNGQMFSRVQAAIVLAMAHDPRNVELFIQQVADPNQLMIVKLWALRGITIATDSGQAAGAISSAQAHSALQTIVAYLGADGELLWPVKVRALEALGSVRTSTVDILNNKAEATTAALAILANPDERLESRAQAAWAIGMLRVPNGVAKYNFPLLAWHVGRCAAAIGDEIERTMSRGISTAIAEESKEEGKASEGAAQQASSGFNTTRVAYLADLIAFQAHTAFVGDPKAADSGLNGVPADHPSIASARGPIGQIGGRVEKLAKAGIVLSRAVGVQVPDAQKSFQAALKDLKDYLGKNPPKDFALVPKGEEFKGAPAKPADAPPAATAEGAAAATKKSR